MHSYLLRAYDILCEKDVKRMRNGHKTPFYERAQLHKINSGNQHGDTRNPFGIKLREEVIHSFENFHMVDFWNGMADY